MRISDWSSDVCSSYLYSIIYDAINDVRDAMEGMLAPQVEEIIVGNAEVREVFKISKVGTILGCMVTDVTIKRSNPIRLLREDRTSVVSEKSVSVRVDLGGSRFFNNHTPPIINV